jgi:hypothetical protein
MATVEAAAPEPAPPVTSPPPAPSTPSYQPRAPKTGASRTIVTLMVFATGASLVSHETNAKGVVETIGGAKIIFGFTAATTILILVAQAGEPAAEFAKGLAVITLASSLLANGSVLAKVLTNLSSGSTPVTPTKTTTAKTTTTTPAKAA